MTVEERLTAAEAEIAALKATLQNLECRTWVDTVTGQRINYLYVNGARVGGDSEFWAKKNLGDGATISVGGADRIAVMAEVDDIHCQTQPTTAGYFAVTQPNPFMQNNIGVHGIANNGVVSYGLMCTSADRTIGFRREGIELIEGRMPYLIGPIGGPYRTLWP